jgi:hypothetical protein
MGTISVGSAMAQGYPGLFQVGLESAAIPATLWQSSCRDELFLPSHRQSGKFDVNAVTRDDARARAESLGHSAHAEKYVNLLHTLPEGTIEQELRGRHEVWEKLVSKWASGSIKNLSLSSVGIAVAHSNWARTIQSESQLGIWVFEGV